MVDGSVDFRSLMICLSFLFCRSGFYTAISVIAVSAAVSSAKIKMYHGTFLYHGTIIAHSGAPVNVYIRRGIISALRRPVSSMQLISFQTGTLILFTLFLSNLDEFVRWNRLNEPCPWDCLSPAHGPLPAAHFPLPHARCRMPVARRAARFRTHAGQGPESILP